MNNITFYVPQVTYDQNYYMEPINEQTMTVVYRLVKVCDYSQIEQIVNYIPIDNFYSLSGNQYNILQNYNLGRHEIKHLIRMKKRYGKELSKVLQSIRNGYQQYLLVGGKKNMSGGGLCSFLHNVRQSMFGNNNNITVMENDSKPIPRQNDSKSLVKGNDKGIIEKVVTAVTGMGNRIKVDATSTANNFKFMANITKAMFPEDNERQEVKKELEKISEDKLQIIANIDKAADPSAQLGIFEKAIQDQKPEVTSQSSTLNYISAAKQRIQKVVDEEREQAKREGREPAESIERFDMSKGHNAENNATYIFTRIINFFLPGVAQVSAGIVKTAVEQNNPSDKGKQLGTPDNNKE